MAGIVACWVKGVDEHHDLVRAARGGAIADAPDSSASEALERVVRAIGDALGNRFDPALALEVSIQLREALAERVSLDALRLIATAELFVTFAEALAADRTKLGPLLRTLESEEDLPRDALAITVLRSSGFARLPVTAAGRVVLSLLVGLVGAHGASVWRLDGGVPERVVAADEDLTEPTSVVALARAVLDGRGSHVSGQDAAAVAVAVDGAGGEVKTALATWGPGTGSVGRVAVLRTAAATLATALQCANLESQASTASEDAAAATQRRLTRLRFDLHDGPQQDVLLLAEDLRLFGSQLGRVVEEEHPDRGRLLGRLEDLEARLVALDGDLRRISSSLQSPFLQPGSLPDAVADLSSAFADRTGIVPDLEMTGDMTRLTDSQHITLLGLLREALSNVREHSDATTVVIRVSTGEDGVLASVRDDGHGFDPETSLLRAAREGHLGLVGMHERVRMLGGNTHIESRPGGPTTISVRLPAAPAAARRHA